MLWVANNQLKIYQDKPRNVLTERDFYTIKFPSGGRSLVVETKFLGGIEGSYAQLYRDKVEERKPFTPQDKAVMAVFLASMLVRGPRRRGAMEDFFGQVRDITDNARHT
jgi:hypothetical protein